MSDIVIVKLEDTSDKEEDRTLIRDFTNEFRPSYSLFGEMQLCMPSQFENVYQNILDLDVRDDDTFCISFPKTGSTWCQEMIWLIGNDLNYEAAKNSLQERFSFLEIQSLFIKTEKNSFIGEKIFNSVDTVANNDSRRFIKTHLPWDFLPTQIQNKEKSPKIIYVSRNVKDCMVSYYHHCRLIEGYRGDFDDFFQLFLGGKLCFAPYWASVLEFWKRRNDKNFLWLEYEEMKADLPAVIKKVAAFLGKIYSNEQVKKLSDHLNFDSMKSNKAVNFEQITDINNKMGINKVDGKFLRSGKVGDYKQHMSEKQIIKINQWTEDAIEGTDYVPFKH